LLNSLHDFKTVLSDAERAKDVLLRLSKHFDLKWTDEEFITKMADEIISYTMLFKREENEEIYFASVDEEKIEIGEDSGRNKRYNTGQ
jgi:hypothetical protein